MNQRVVLTKTLLKNSLITMLQTQSIYQISIRELCERAGINRSTFYKYYGNQFDLLNEMEKDLLINIEKTLVSVEEYDKNVLEQIITYLEKDIDFIRLLLNYNVDPEFPKDLMSMAPIHQIIKSQLVDLPESEQDYYYRFLLFGCYEIVRTWINKEERESPKTIAELILKIIPDQPSAKPKKSKARS